MEKLYKREEGIILENVMGQYLLCDLNRGLFGEVNEFGAEIWSLLEDWNRPEEILENLKKVYEMEEKEAILNIFGFLTALEDKGFVICE
nr:PqqD family protein [Paenibacillus bovis]